MLRLNKEEERVFYREDFVEDELEIITHMQNWYAKAKELKEGIKFSLFGRLKENTTNIFLVLRGAMELQSGRYYRRAETFGIAVAAAYRKKDMNKIGELLTQATTSKPAAQGSLQERVCAEA